MKKRLIRTICIMSMCIMAFTVLPTGTYAKAKESGKYPTQAGRILVTSDCYKNLIPTGHAAIVLDKTYVVEAKSNGVVLGRNNWKSQKKQFWGVQVLQKKRGSVLSAAKQKKAASWCKKQRGKHYNFNYLNTKTRSRFYCSQLAWAAYKDNFKIDLNTLAFAGWYSGWGYANPVHPLELVDSNYTRIDYYYKR